MDAGPWKALKLMKMAVLLKSFWMIDPEYHFVIEEVYFRVWFRRGVFDTPVGEC